MFIGTVKVKLSKETKWEGKDISMVELDFGKVNGVIINRCERETFGGGNISGLNRPTSSEYCARLAAEISGVPFRAIEKLPFYDYEKIWQTVSAFVRHDNPQKFYDQFIEGDDDADFMDPAEKPGEKAEKLKESEKTETKLVTK
jgi:hypothetical protein